MTKPALLLLTLLSLAACEGSNGSLLGNEDTPLCEQYNSCDSSCKLYGNCGKDED